MQNSGSSLCLVGLTSDGRSRRLLPLHQDCWQLLLGYLSSGGLQTFDLGHFVSVQDLNLWHSPDDLLTIFRFLCQWVAIQVQLLEKRELLKELKEVVQVTQLVVTDEENAQEIESLDAFYTLELIALAVYFFDTEV